VRAHGRDERVGVKQFYEGLEFQYRLIKALAQGADGRLEPISAISLATTADFRSSEREGFSRASAAR